jgi:hypothetical protein
LRGVFFEPGSARTLGDTEKNSDKFMPSEDVAMLHFLGSLYEEFVKLEMDTKF